MVMHLQCFGHDLADQVGVFGDDDAQRVFHGTHRGQRVAAGTNPANALHESPGVTWVAAFENDLQPAPHGAGGDRVADDVVFVNVDFAAHVALNACHRVDDDASARVVQLEALCFGCTHGMCPCVLVQALVVLSLVAAARLIADTAAWATPAAPTPAGAGP